jgi:hypothetical protein
VSLPLQVLWSGYCFNVSNEAALMLSSTGLIVTEKHFGLLPLSVSLVKVKLLSTKKNASPAHH